MTSGQIIGAVDDSPRDMRQSSVDPPQGNDDWLPEKMGALIARTQAFCDVMSLGPPDGLFLDAFRDSLETLYDRSKTTGEKNVVRFMFGNIAGMPVNCDRVIKALTKDIPEDSNLRVWVVSVLDYVSLFDENCSNSSSAHRGRGAGGSRGTTPS